MSEAFPFVGASEALIQASSDTQDLPSFKEFAWDFEKNCFLYDKSGKHILLEGTEAIKIWVYKALATERYTYLAYSWQYGIEIKPFIGLVMGVQERISELKRMITECLMVNPYILSINDISFSQEGRKATVTIDLTTVYGEVSA